MPVTIRVSGLPETETADRATLLRKSIAKVFADVQKRHKWDCGGQFYSFPREAACVGVCEVRVEIAGITRTPLVAQDLATTIGPVIYSEMRGSLAKSRKISPAVLVRCVGEDGATLGIWWSPRTER